MNQLSLLPRHKQHLLAGAIHIPDWLCLKQQQQLLEHCRDWAKPPAGLYSPQMPDGKPLSVQVMCLGWHWYPYRYSRTRDNCDRFPCKPFPDELQALAQQALKDTLPQYAGRRMDAAMLNFYAPDAKLGMHQDKSESEQVRAQGSPIVSISLGDSCLFRFGNAQSRSGPYQDIELQSGDLFVFGGVARMAYHGVLKIHPGTAPVELGIRAGRLNINMRETGFDDTFDDAVESFAKAFEGTVIKDLYKE